MLSSQSSDPLFLLDESLSPNVARALSSVNYDVVNVHQAFGGRSGVVDPEIIKWCKDHEAIWIYADDRARKQHRRQIIAAGIRSLWVYRRRGAMSSKEQLRILGYILPDLIDRYEKQPRQLHYQASVLGEAPRSRIRLTPSPL